jgi:hypothetical protein
LTRHVMNQYQASISREATAGTTEGNPESVYDVMVSTDAPQPGWREGAAQTAGVAGVGARSRFTDPMNQYKSPFDDRS